MTIKSGTRVRVNESHWGARGSTGRVAAIKRIEGRTFYKVLLTGGRAAGFPMNFRRDELEVR